jgi:pimeloyl-ACP methyl ester carboxylesterase
VPFEAPPPLPADLAKALPPGRTSYRLEQGDDAGRRLHVVDQGDRGARAVLLLHGNPMWSFLWRKVIALLPELRCVAPDLLGFGFSDKPRRVRDYSLARESAAIAELVAALDLDAVVLVGQDWGGPIATAVGAALPERISGLVLANTSILPPRLDRRGTAFHRLARVPLLSTLLFRGLGFPLGRLDRMQGDRRSLADPIAAAYRRPLARWSERAGPLALARMVPHHPGHPSLPTLQAGAEWALAYTGPVALVWGESDPLLGRLLGRHERAFPTAQVTRTSAGHFLQEEVPEAIAAAIRHVVRVSQPG